MALMSSVSRPTTPKGRATAERLLDAARQVAIDNDGHIEIAMVAEAAGVVPSLIHRYFGSKAGLVAALIDDFYDRFHAAVLDRDLDAHGDWATHEYERLELGVRFHYAQPFSCVLHGLLARDPEVARREAERIADVVDRSARSIRKGQKKGELPVGVNPRLAGAAMFGAMQQVLVEAMTHSPRPSARKVIDVLWRQVAASVQIDPDVRKSPAPRTSQTPPPSR